MTQEATHRRAAPEAQSPGAALEHLTGPSRGKVTWLGQVPMDITLNPNRTFRAQPTRPDTDSADLIARLTPDGDGHEIEAVNGRRIWVNGQPVGSRRLAHCDMIEFCENGPISRYRLYDDGHRPRHSVGDIVSDAAAYMRASRKPIGRRSASALGQFLRRTTLETTLLFRFGVIVALVVLGTLVYQQYRMNRMLQQEIASGAARLEDFSRILARSREEALTPRDLDTLRQELASRMTTTAERLSELERRSGASARIIAASMSSVVFVQGAYGFRETATGRMLRQVLGDDGKPMILPSGLPLLTLEGDGPVAERQYTGTAFAIGNGGLLVTNRHVALPWEHDTSLQLFAGRGLEPVMVRLVAYPPGVAEPMPARFVRASDRADVAILAREPFDEHVDGLRLADGPPKPGDEVIVMGYPTGLRSMLAQAGEAFVKELQATSDIDFWSVAQRLAGAGRIAPLASRGIVARASEQWVVFDAETTHGGSGGPVLDVDGAVVAVQAAILPEYGGSNLGVPAAEVRRLLEEGIN